MIGGILVEKDLETVKKDLDIQITNVNEFNFRSSRHLRWFITL
jgi:hypothetical protein